LNFKPVKDALIIAELKAIPDLKRNPSIVILIGLVSSFPLFFLLVFGANLSYGLVGAMIATISFIGLVAAIQDITFDRYVKIREMIVAMPVHPVSYAMGVALAPLLISAPGLIFFVGIAVLLGVLPVLSIGWVLASLILCWAAASSVGFIISTYLQKASVYTLNNMSNILGLGLVFLPPVYYPEEFLGSFRWVSMIFPTSNAAGLIRFYAGLTQLSQGIVLVRWLVLVATVIGSVVIVSFKARWTES
jgi:ABC-type multidrug transport system permease subunit